MLGFKAPSGSQPNPNANEEINYSWHTENPPILNIHNEVYPMYM